MSTTRLLVFLAGIYIPDVIHGYLINSVPIKGASMYEDNKCYYCYKGATLQECRHIEGCGSTPRMCFMEMYKSKSGIFYHGGCASIQACESPGQSGLVNISGDNERVCATCCKSRFCNANLCGNTVHGLPIYVPPQHPPIHTPNDVMKCFSCDGVYNIKECSETQTCRAGQSCYLETFLKDNRMTYYGGCASNQNCSSGLSAHKGTKVCATCCKGALCNHDVCGTQIAAFNAAHTNSKRQCYQCYDQKVDDIHRCFKKVTCSSSKSECSQVMRNEHGILTVDLDCKENLPCQSDSGRSHQVCSVCCNSDGCNRDVDCRNPIHKGTIQVSPTRSSTTTTTIVPTSPHPRQCYQCSDMRLDSYGVLERCHKTVTCTATSSRCSTVYREEHGIVSVDMDCEDNLNCDQHQSQIQLCGRCCDTDMCNYDNDCRQREET